ncbi:peptidylprolyl isomerase [Primorskyibacter flagellatus]|uniref:peptidylprolyl isomerase n=1 Tax=Primorskyibacter flagellatus TaxID=1387277 RepID=UPI003A92DECB
MRLLSYITATLALCITVLTLPSPALAQFSPVILVNDSAISGYELEQRTRMLTLLNAPGNPTTLAREQLIDDRLRVEAASAAGIRPTDEEITEGMTEFAGRANLSREEFTAALAGSGVDEQTFRAFVQAGLAWRQLVQARFGSRSAASEGEIDRALSSSRSGGGVRVLLSELIMPAPPQQAAAVRERANRISQIRSTDAFSAEARRYSATASRGRGGRLDWQNLSDLPPQLQPLILALAPGEVTDPLPIPNAVALFQLRAIEETGYKAPEYAAIEYAAYYIPGGRTEAALAAARNIQTRVDTCDDLYGVAKGQPAEVLDRGSLPPAEIPTDIAVELMKLDAGEVSTALTRSNGQTLVFLMLCGRTPVLTEEVNREQLTMGLRNQRLNSYANGYLAQLRAEARIRNR